MSTCMGQQSGARAQSGIKAACVAFASLSLGACAGMGDGTDFLTKAATPLAGDTSTVASAPAESTGQPGELQKATEYWGKAYAEKPQNLEAALSYSKNLKAMGQKAQAMAVLQQASVYHGANKQLASEYGRLALELDQVTVAQQMLALADDPVAPDWRVISARGTALAKQGKYQEAIPFYERAQTLAPDKPSILNNLAMALAMNGEAAKAEEMLRRAGSTGVADAKVNQNLALVLGLQGKYDEATKVASQALPADKAASNTALVRQMVKLEPKVMPHGVIAAPPPVMIAGAPVPAALAGFKPAVADAARQDSWSTKVATATAAPRPAPAKAPASTIKPEPEASLLDSMATDWSSAVPVHEQLLRSSAE